MTRRPPSRLRARPRGQGDRIDDWLWHSASFADRQLSASCGCGPGHPLAKARNAPTATAGGLCGCWHIVGRSSAFGALRLWHGETSVAGPMITHTSTRACHKKRGQMLAAHVGALPEVGEGSLHRYVRGSLDEFARSRRQQPLAKPPKYARASFPVVRRSRGRPRRAAPRLKFPRPAAKTAAGGGR